jgi:hypothetical protein
MFSMQIAFARAQSTLNYGHALRKLYVDRYDAFEYLVGPLSSHNILHEKTGVSSRYNHAVRTGIL